MSTDINPRESVYIRLINPDQQEHNDESRVVSSLIRMLNDIRFWTTQIQLEDITDQASQLTEATQELLKLLKHAYVIFQAKHPVGELKSFEDQLYQFESKYITEGKVGKIQEKTVEFAPDRYAFLIQSLHAVIHDLSQPLISLQMIIGSDNQDQDKTTQTQQALEFINAQLDRGFEITTGAFVIEELSVNTLIQISQQVASVISKEDMIDFEVRDQAHNERVLYSRVWFRGLLSNVIDNAKKSFWIKGERLGHGDFERKISLTFCSDKINHSDPAISIIIEDTGIGFAREVLHQGFVQGESQWHRDDLKGQGVGMAAHIAFVQKLRGEVELRNINKTGIVQGAQLVVTLPTANS